MILSISVETDDQTEVAAAIAILKPFLQTTHGAAPQTRPTRLGVRQVAVLDYLEAQPGAATTRRIVAETAKDMPDGYARTCKLLAGLLRQGFVRKPRRGVYEAVR